MADSDKIKQDTEAAAKSAGDLKDNFADVVDLTDQLSGAMMGFLQALGSSNIGLNQARKSARSLLKNQQTLEEVQLGLSKMSSKELKNLKAASIREKKRLEDAVDFIKINVEGKRQLTAQEAELIAASEQNFAIEQAHIDAIQAKIEKRIEEEQRLGLTGVALDNLGRIGIRALGGIGINLGALQGDFDAVTDKVEDLAKAGESKFKIFGAAVAATGPIIVKSLSDPAAISLISFDKLTKAFVKVQKSSVEFGRLTGQNETIASSLNTRFADTAEILETATALTKQLGINANNAFSRDVIAAAAEIQNEMGLSVEEASKLAVVTQTTSGDFDAITESIVDSVSAFNRTNKAAVSQGIVLRDVANTSDDILVSFNNQPGALAEAAAAARRLGLDLAKVDQVATSLLDFESSIGNELEAQLLTGKYINLEKAREFALTNDLEGLSNELFNNSASIAEFSSMNRIAQEAQAKALGLSRQELAKIALQQSINLGITDSQLEAAAGVTAEDLKRVEVQERIEKAISKITTALVGPAEFLASMAESTGVIYGAMGLLASIKLGSLISQLVTASALSATAGAGGLTLASSLTFGLGAAAIIAAIAGITYAVKKSKKDMTKVSDGMIAPDGGLVVSGPKGSIQLDPNDSIVAGTNLNGNSGGNSTPVWAERLIAAVEKGGNVYIDGNKAGEALVLGTYKSS